MNKIPLSMITKQGIITESFYDYLISRYVAPFFTIFFKWIGLTTPNIITLFSFSLIIVSSIMVLQTELLANFYYRLLIAIVIQVSFIMDCSDGQLARVLGRTSKIGAWFDRVFDRVGEFIIFTSFGFAASILYSRNYFIFLGILTGYMLAAFTLAMSLGDSLILENFKKFGPLIELIKSEENSSIHNSKKIGFKDILSKIFFFLNFGIGERYLYLSFFMLINKLELMLYIVSFLSFTRTLGIFFHVRKKLKYYDQLLRAENDKN